MKKKVVALLLSTMMAMTVIGCGDNKDTKEDVATITADYPDAKPGSTCFVIESSSVYMLNNNKEWKEI